MTAIVVVENIHRHLEEGKTPVQGVVAGRTRNRRPGYLHDHHAGRGVRADRLPRRLDRIAVPGIRLYTCGLGDRFRRDRADLVADDVFGISQECRRRPVCENRQPGVRRDDALVRPATRSLARLSAGSRRCSPVTMLGLIGFLYTTTSKETGARGRSGHRVLREPRRPNTRQHRLYRLLRRQSSTRRFAKFPETDLRFVLNGINGPQGGIAGMLLKPWDERTRSSIKLKPLVQAELSKIEGVNAFAFNLPPLPGGPRWLAGADGDQFDRGFPGRLRADAEAEGRRAQERPVHRYRQATFDFNQPVVRIKIDRSKASDLGINMQQIGNHRWRRCLAATTSPGSTWRDDPTR